MRGTGYIGTAGFGFVAWVPSLYANDVNCLSVSNINTFAGTTVTTANPTTGVGFLKNTQFPYNATGNVRARVVGAGLRIRYTGTELNMGGLIVPYSVSATNTGAPLLNANQDTLLNQPDAKSIPVDKNWHGCVWRAHNSATREYTQYTTAIDGLGTWMVNTIVGTAGQSFEWEAVSFYELISSLNVVVNNTSSSNSDPVGFGAISDFVGSITGSEMGTTLYNKAVKHLENVTFNHLSTLMPVLFGAGDAYLQNMNRPRLEL